MRNRAATLAAVDERYFPRPCASALAFTLEAAQRCLASNTFTQQKFLAVIVADAAAMAPTRRPASALFACALIAHISLAGVTIIMIAKCPS